MNSTERNRYKNWKRTLCLDLTSEEVIDNIIKINYKKSNLLPKTKEYIKSLIKTYGRDLDTTNLKSIILKEDFIDEYNKSRENNNFKPDYDFSLLPDIINNKLEKVTVICRNTICGIEIGEFETSFSNLVDHKRDVFRLNALEKDVNPNLKENPEKTRKFKEAVIKLYGPDRFNLDNVRIIESYSIFPVKIFCNTCKRFFWVQPYYFLKGNGCERCNLEQKAKDALKVTFDIWKERAIEKHQDEYDYSLTEKEYVNQFTPVHIKCNTCGTVFEQTPFSHINTDCPCPECRKILTSITQSKDGKSTWEKLVEICGPNYDFSGVPKSVGRRDTIEYRKISTNETFITKAENILSGHIEPGKSKSTGETLTEGWLIDHNILFKEQVRIKDVQGREQNYVIIDFEISNGDKTIIIEINGRQHYCEDSFIVVQKYSERYTFEQQITRDQNVKQYCLDNNITFIEIPYTYFTYKKINDILTRVILNNESPDFIEIPEIKYC